MELHGSELLVRVVARGLEEGKALLAELLHLLLAVCVHLVVEGRRRVVDEHRERHVRRGEEGKLKDRGRAAEHLVQLHHVDGVVGSEELLCHALDGVRDGGKELVHRVCHEVLHGPCVAEEANHVLVEGQQVGHVRHAHLLLARVVVHRHRPAFAVVLPRHAAVDRRLGDEERLREPDRQLARPEEVSLRLGRRRRLAAQAPLAAGHLAWRAGAAQAERAPPLRKTVGGARAEELCVGAPVARLAALETEAFAVGGAFVVGAEDLLARREADERVVWVVHVLDEEVEERLSHLYADRALLALVLHQLLVDRERIDPPLHLLL
mmetsp:Transcript_22646/g.89596  ORF Transcript_22646/g.89596 Transcript_22646/m.89596 type:complete len:322 (+) Transcript_22646:747-1712(+)